MAGYDVVIGKIRETGKASQRVADGVRGAHSSAVLPTGDVGMPGSRCVGKLAQLKQVWTDRENAAETGLVFHASSMSTAADMYSTREDAAQHDLTTAAQPTNGPKPI